MVGASDPTTIGMLLPTLSICFRISYCLLEEKVGKKRSTNKYINKMQFFFGRLPLKKNKGDRIHTMKSIIPTTNSILSSSIPTKIEQSSTFIIDKNKVNYYPYYFYIYILQLYLPVFFCFSVVLLCYVRQQSLRRIIFMEFNIIYSFYFESQAAAGL